MADVNSGVPALEIPMNCTASAIDAFAGPMLAPWMARQDATAKLIGVKAEANSWMLIADTRADARRGLAMSDEVGHGFLGKPHNLGSMSKRPEFRPMCRRSSAQIRS